MQGWACGFTAVEDRGESKGADEKIWLEENRWRKVLILRSTRQNEKC